jgi:hypothetical protein
MVADTCPGHEPEGLEHGQVAAAPSDRADQGVGHGAQGEQGHQPRQQPGQSSDALEVADIGVGKGNPGDAGEVPLQLGDGLVAVDCWVDPDQIGLGEDRLGIAGEAAKPVRVEEAAVAGGDDVVDATLVQHRPADDPQGPRDPPGFRGDLDSVADLFPQAA